MSKATYPLGLMAAIILSACIQLGSPAPPQQFYLLEADPALAAANSELTAIIAVGLSDFPDHLKRAPVVATVQNHQIHFSDAHRWAEPLDSSLLKTIGRNLQRQLPAATIAIQPWENRREPQHRINIAVTDFNGILGDKLEMSIRWQISGNGREQRGTFTDNRPLGSAYADLVAALNAAVSEFSQVLAQQLSAATP